MTWHSAVAMAALAVGLGAQGLPPAQVVPPAPVVLPTLPMNGSPLEGGVASATAATSTPLALSLSGAVQMGLRNNLAALLASSTTEQARAQRMAALAALLPQVNASAGEVRQKLNLAAFGFSFPGFPSIVGPFNVFQASAAASVPVVNLSALQNARAAKTLQHAAQDNLEETRDVVVLAIANQYLLSVADQSRVEAAQAELATANSALQQAQDMLKAGTVGALSAVRAQVQRDRQSQLLTAQQNALAKQRLQLARAVGLPPGQAFTLTTTVQFQPLAAPDAASAVAQALASRQDYRAAQSVERAAQLLIASARDEHLPTLSLNGNYGTIGHEIDSNHPIFEVGASINLPIFAGGLYRAEAVRAEAQLHDAQNRLADLRSQIDVQVRSALLDLDSNRAQVQVAQDARSLADQELTLAQDRFKAGVADNLEVVQAQQAVADADESYISSLYSYNLAKADLAQALGVAANGYAPYLPQ
ncbi:MAG TPA: TolC family protein [Terriglobales bacterium]|nr:TolC family protein [Terriglobales bacterium]